MDLVDKEIVEKEWGVEFQPCAGHLTKGQYFQICSGILNIPSQATNLQEILVVLARILDKRESGSGCIKSHGSPTMRGVNEYVSGLEITATHPVSVDQGCFTHCRLGELPQDRVVFDGLATW